MNEVKHKSKRLPLWSVDIGMYLYIHNSNLFSLLSQFVILYLSFKGLLQTFCLLMSEITFSFLEKLHNISPGSAVSDSEMQPQ